MTLTAPLTGRQPDNAFADLLGPQIGRGIARVVHECAGHEGWVIKVALTSGAHANWAEWFLWRQIHGETELAGMFGRCAALSESCKYLMMERLDDITTADQAKQQRAPIWVTDREPSHFGVTAGGLVKLRHYGNVAIGRCLSQIGIAYGV